MIARIWHGWTKPDYAESYERLLKEVIFPGIAAKEIKGFKKVQLLRRPLEDEVEFITIMWFENRDAVIAFAGDEYKRAFVPAEARNLLSRFDGESAHFEMIGSQTY